MPANPDVSGAPGSTVIAVVRWAMSLPVTKSVKYIIKIYTDIFQGESNQKHLPGGGFQGKWKCALNNKASAEM